MGPKTETIEPNISFINAGDVWGLGVDGSGTVMAGNDTGLDETHPPAIAPHYRGCLDPPACTTWDHNYNWWDAWGDFPNDPYDDYGHGTHTTGTMVGDDGGENHPEYIFRVFYIIVLAYTFTGIFLQAVLPKKTEDRPDHKRTWVKPFLGWTESAIVLGSINLLFAFFVIIQFRYLFGGQANITAAGYTYSEYARKGFGELVTVAVLSLLIYLCLAAVTRTKTRGQRTGFSTLSTLLMVLVLIMLASSLQRMLLYEGAYGFTRLRTYTHVFIFCLAALLIATVVLELTGNRGRFGLALLLFSFTFAIALGVMNVDAFIANQNIQRVSGPHGDWKTLDGYYLSELSSDAVPVIAAAYQNPALPEKARDQLGAELACRLTLAAREVEENPVSWQSYHPSNARAIQLMNNLSDQLFEKYSVRKDEYGGLFVPLGFDRYDCYYEYWID